MGAALWKVLKRGRSVGVVEGGSGKQRINSRPSVVSTGAVSRRRRGRNPTASPKIVVNHLLLVELTLVVIPCLGITQVTYGSHSVHAHALHIRLSTVCSR